MDKFLGFKTTVTSLLALSMVLAPRISRAGELQYFDGPVNYWSKDAKAQVDPAPKQEVTNSKPEIAKRDDAANTITKEKEEFQWTKYLDPNNKDFFREGDYTPPEPFMELVRNPTDQNIRMWFAYMDRKNELASRGRCCTSRAKVRSKNRCHLSGASARCVPSGVNVPANTLRWKSAALAPGNGCAPVSIS